jgi:hypothetical protein
MEMVKRGLAAWQLTPAACVDIEERIRAVVWEQELGEGPVGLNYYEAETVATHWAVATDFFSPVNHVTASCSPGRSRHDQPPPQPRVQQQAPPPPQQPSAVDLTMGD